jgi:AcrR family transcriptional regulator
MKKRTFGKRRYSSPTRDRSAAATRANILHAARSLFSRHGIDRVTIDAVAMRAGVSGSTVYVLFKSKAGLLQSLMERALFGSRFAEAQRKLAGVTDPVRLVEFTADVALAVYEGEAKDLGLLRAASGFSPDLRKLEQEFEARRYEMQRQRIELLFSAGLARPDLDIDAARQIMWMYTSRDIYRLLVIEAGWTPATYRRWLSRTLKEALVAPVAR